MAYSFSIDYDYTNITFYIDQTSLPDDENGNYWRCYVCTLNGDSIIDEWIGWKSGAVTFSKTFSGQLSSNTSYFANVLHSKQDGSGGSWIGRKSFTTDKAPLQDFSWKLNSYIGSDGKTYMNNYNGKPAPVTADEWNRFCAAASDRGITITGATQGGSMLAAVQSASNKLGVDLPEGNKVTLQFFTDLAKALNNK